MGRRSSKRQQTSSVSRCPGQAEVVAPVVTTPVTAQSLPVMEIESSIPDSVSDVSETETLVSTIDARELTLAKREADLQARRRDAAREIRRQHRESLKIDTRLAGIESLISELTQNMLQLGHEPIHSAPTAESAAEDSEIKAELEAEIQALRDEIESLTMQNEQLAGDLAQSSIRRSIGKSGDADATLTWEQRKAMIFAQEDADSAASSNSETDDVKSLRTNMDRLRRDVQARDFELAQLRDLLEQRPTTCEEGTAIGAAAIAQMMDSDELVREERQRLQDLQTEWETKFRKMEIAASIERANLARERQQLERQNAELEEQLAHLKRELRQEEITGPNQTRRWFAKLGLGD